MTLNDLIVLGNALLALLAAVVGLWAATRGVPALRVIHAATGALALLYALSYGYLLVDLDGRLRRWSEVMRGVALIVWPIAWIWPPLASVRRYREAKARVDRLDVEAMLRETA